jgi:DNA-binding winged helix-turn-helix (wHTH) protein
LSDQPHGRYSFGAFHLDADQHLLTRDARPVALPPKCFDLLCLLVSSQGELLEKERLLRTLWPETFVEEANLSNLIALLRKALGDSPAASQYIRTVPKLGYRFVALVNPSAGTDQPRRAERDRQRAIRVLVFPFRCADGCSELAHLAFSLPEAISTTLAELNVFTVRCIQVAMRFDPVHWDPQQVGKEADVDIILGGTLEYGADRAMHVVTHLVDAPKGTLLWSKSWNVSQSDLFPFHQAVVHLLVRSLVRGGTEDGSYRLTADVPSSSESYDLYLRANQSARGYTFEGISLARDLYLACLEKDPNYAPAWARLGRCYHVLRKFQPESATDAASALRALDRAFALNPDLGIAHNLCTPIQADAGQAESAMVRLLQRATAHDNDPELFCGLVQACRYCGLQAESLEAHRRARELDPGIKTSVAHTYFAMGHYDEALYWYGAGKGIYLDALALASMGREQEALGLMRMRRNIFSALPAQMHSLEAYLSHERTRGLAALRAGWDAEFRDPESRFYLARQAARLGDADLANEILRQSVEEGYWSTQTLMGDPWLASLRDTAVFRRTYEDVAQREAQSRTAFIEAGGERVLGPGCGDRRTRRLSVLQ